MNYTRILMSASMIAFVGALVFGGTQAFFSDEETSAGNLFTAGALDLLVDSESHYAGLVCNDQGEWEDDPNIAEPTTRPELDGEPCDGTWEETDLGPEHTFFNFDDLKPGDSGENTISLHVFDNDAWACAIIDNMQNDDNGLTEPEADAGDTSGGDDEGELADEIHFFAWADNGGAQAGNNIWEDGEPSLFSNIEGPASDVIDGVVYPLFTPDLNNGAVLQATTTAYIGLYWCYGDIDVDEDTNTLSCDGSQATNITQTDSLSADITFYVEQVRNNPDFSCPLLDDDEGEELIAAALGDYESPEQCDLTVTGDPEASAPEYETIEEAVSAATANQTICVEDGDYDLSEPLVLDVEGLTLASQSGPLNSATITGGLFIDASNVTVTGFIFDGFDYMGSSENAAIYIHNETGQGSGTSLEGVEISYNLFDAPAGAADSITTINGGDGSNAIINEIPNSATPQFSNSLITHNVFDGWRRGVFLNPSSGITVSYNDFYNNFVGSANDGPGGNSVVRNDFEGNTAESLGVSDADNGTGNNNILSVNFNNIADGAVNNYGAVELDANDNWWGGDGPAGQIEQAGGGTVDADPEAVSAFPEN